MLSGKQLRWCSLRCSKLGLKSLYKKRKAKQIREYNKIARLRKRIYITKKRRKNEYLKLSRYEVIKLLGEKCVKCGINTNLTINHKIPKVIGGNDKLSNIEVMCGPCNSKEYAKIVKLALGKYYGYPKR